MQNKEMKEALKSMKRFVKCRQDMEAVTAREMRVVLEYIDKLETKIKELGKGQHTLMQSRRKWKNKYYKERRRRKEADKSVWQIYDNYQDIGNMYFDLDEKVQDIIKQIQWAVDFTKTNNSIISKTQVECLENVLKILKGEKEKC